MLTVKHISLSGEEMIYPTPLANYTPDFNKNIVGASPRPHTPETVWIDQHNDGSRQPLTGGTVFVMNEHGKTVARYDLGASMVPLSDGGPLAPKTAAPAN